MQDSDMLDKDKIPESIEDVIAEAIKNMKDSNTLKIEKEIFDKIWAPGAWSGTH
jgi:hypothetical protein